LDRMGSWSSFAFQLKAYEKGDIQREMYNKNVDGYVRAGAWTYGVEEFGFHYFNTNVIKSMDLNSNWMDEGMAQYYEELMTSPQTFLKIVTDDQATQTITDVVAGTTNYDVQARKVDIRLC